MKNIIFLSILTIALASCISDDYFGLSQYGNIKSFEISNQASQAVINNETYEVSVEIPAGVDVTNLTLKTLTLSSFATADKNIGDELDFTADVSIKVTAENGQITTWTIKASAASSTPQLAYSDFNTWYETNGGFYEPGEDASTTIWGTGNAGTQILNLLATTPIELEDNNLAVKMETLDNGKLAATFGTPISAGSVFTGLFDKDKIDPIDPEAAINFGIPFASRPQKIKFSYSYIPGAENKDKNGDLLSEPDMFDIYAILEIRTADNTERLAAAWFRDGDIQESLSEKELDFYYGELDPSMPDYMFPENGQFVSSDSASFMLPTHITFVASSSYDGANFAGAIGSVLIVDDVELIY